jgi:hypothetical protein
VANELIANIRNHPSFDESVHSALTEVIENQYSPEQLRVMQCDPVVWDSLVRGMLDSMLASQSDADNETDAHKFRLRQAEELMRKTWGFLNQRAQNTEDARVELRAG